MTYGSGSIDTQAWIWISASSEAAISRPKATTTPSTGIISLATIRAYPSSRPMTKISKTILKGDKLRFYAKV